MPICIVMRLRAGAILRTNGRRICIDGVRPEYLSEGYLRKRLEYALPYLKGASLKSLIYEYWRSGQHFDNLRVTFRYYP